MSFYIGAAMADMEHARHIADALEHWGQECTFRWFDLDPAENWTPERRREVAELEINGVRYASGVILIMPGGRGMHAELGAAFVLNKPVLMLCREEPKFSLFYEHENVEKVICPELYDCIQRAREFVEKSCRRLTFD